MSSLWTPYGEQPVEPDQPGTPSAQSPPGTAGFGDPDDFGGPPYDETGEEIDPEQMREMLARLAATPVEAVVTQFVEQLQELAVLHLGLAQERTTSLPQSEGAIPGIAELVEGLGLSLDPTPERRKQVLATLTNS